MTFHADDRLTCIDGGPKHAWESAGLDVPDEGRLAGRLVHVTRCVWCKSERRRTYKASEVLKR